MEQIHVRLDDYSVTGKVPLQLRKEGLQQGHKASEHKPLIIHGQYSEYFFYDCEMFIL
jgi:hypothetical protein